MFYTSRRFLSLSLIIFAATGNQLPGMANPVPTNTESVPLTRLLLTLDQAYKSTSNNAVRAKIEFEIGRLHSMAYALKTEEASIIKSLSAKKTTSPYDYVGPYAQFPVIEAVDPRSKERAQAHLALATLHLYRCLQLDPAYLPAKLGLAWCQLENGDRTGALPRFREVFNIAWQQEKNAPKDATNVIKGMEGSSIALEASFYLRSILDKNKDALELKDIEQKSHHLSTIFR